MSSPVVRPLEFHDELELLNLEPWGYISVSEKLMISAWVLLTITACDRQTDRQMDISTVTITMFHLASYATAALKLMKQENCNLNSVFIL